MTIPNTFSAFRIHNDAAGYRAGIESIGLDDLNPGEVVIKSEYSSVNFKDALAGTGDADVVGRCDATESRQYFVICLYRFFPRLCLAVAPGNGGCDCGAADHGGTE